MDGIEKRDFGRGSQMKHTCLESTGERVGKSGEELCARVLSFLGFLRRGVACLISLGLLFFRANFEFSHRPRNKEKNERKGQGGNC